MNKTVAVVILIVGMAALGAIKYFELNESQELMVSTSDASAISAEIRIGVDNWTGYYLLCSKYFNASLRNAGIRASCENDNADLDKRFKKLRKNKLEFAVTTVDAYVAAGAQHQFPGTIVAIIDESKGGDALLAWQDKIVSIDDLKNDPSLRVALTPDSPSEHLLRSLAVHFDIQDFKHRGAWFVGADGSEDAAKKLLSKQVDAAVLWEPDLTKALQQKGIKKVIGTEDTKRLIVDVLLVNRQLASDNPELVKQVLDVYFATLRYYKSNNSKLVNELKKATALDKDAVNSMLKGVKWISLTENAHDWFATGNNATSSEYLAETIESSLHILQETKVLTSNPLPNKNPYSITQSRFVSELYAQNIQAPQDTTTNDQVVKFDQLAPSKWQNLREVGTLKVRSIKFSRSSGELSLDAKRMLDGAALDLAHYPNFRILVKGHTGLGGEQAANQALSQDRADAVLRYLMITHDIDANRLLAQGVGSSQPLPKRASESRRSYKYRLPRVQLILKAGDI